jgi:hypothetical protein
MFLTDPARWQRLAMAAGAAPLLFVGGAFLASEVWSLSSGEWSWLSIWFGAPMVALGTVLAVAALLPRGRAREVAVDSAGAAFLICLALAVSVPLVHAAFR